MSPFVCNTDGNFKNLWKKASLSVQSAVTNYHKLGGSNNRNLFLTFLKTASPKSRCQPSHALSEGSKEESVPGLSLGFQCCQPCLAPLGFKTQHPNVCLCLPMTFSLWAFTFCPRCMPTFPLLFFSFLVFLRFYLFI